MGIVRGLVQELLAMAAGSRLTGLGVEAASRTRGHLAGLRPLRDLNRPGGHMTMHDMLHMRMPMRYADDYVATRRGFREPTRTSQ